MATPIPGNRAAFTAAEIAFATSGVLVRGEPERAAVGVCTDSRIVQAGSVFFALRGESYDGHHFLEAAIAAGASVLVVERAVETAADVAIVRVEDALVALGKLARAHRLRWARAHRNGAVVIGITGSAGKTTTKELTAAAVASALGDDAVLATRGNLNNRIGVPMTVFGLEHQHRVAVLEMGTSVKGEIASLVAIGAPDVGVLVNVGIAHAEGLAIAGASPREAVAREKSAVLTGASSFAVACADDAWASAALLSAPDEVIPLGFGRSERAGYRMTELTFAPNGRPRVSVARTPRADGVLRPEISYALPLFGEMAALDSVGAVAAVDAALELLGLPPIDGARFEAALAQRVRAVPGRLCLRTRNDGAWILDDTYNASPAAFVASIEVARGLALGAGRRLVVVAGEMRELGAFAEGAHDDVGAKLVEASAARVVTLGGLADRYAEALRAAGRPVESFENSRAATAIADSIGSGDLVLVKASRGVTAELVVDAILARGGEMPEGSRNASTRGGA